jgi:hypothetical protein
MLIYIGQPSSREAIDSEMAQRQCPDVGREYLLRDGARLLVTSRVRQPFYMNQGGGDIVKVCQYGGGVVMDAEMPYAQLVDALVTDLRLARGEKIEITTRDAKVTAARDPGSERRALPPADQENKR